MADLNPVCLIRRILRDIPTIIAGGLIAAMLTLTISQFAYKPVYTSTATLAVTVTSGNVASIGLRVTYSVIL